MSILFVTILESLYLFYMYFVFKTKHSFDNAFYDKETQSLGGFFIHNTGVNENKICPFGKTMAIVAIVFAFIRAYFLINNQYKTQIIYATLIFDTICISLAYLMNMNAFVYVLPLIVAELYICFKI
jgi:hypothetical protein